MWWILVKAKSSSKAANRKRSLPDDSSKNENQPENLDDPAKIAKHDLEKDDDFFIDSKDDQPLDESGKFLSLQLKNILIITKQVIITQEI